MLFSGKIVIARCPTGYLPGLTKQATASGGSNLTLKETKGMPSYVLDEVLDFIQFIKEKKLKKKRKDTLQNSPKA